MSTSQAWQSDAVTQEPVGMGNLAVRVSTAAPMVNLLPPEYAERDAVRKLQAVMACAVAVTVVGLGMVYLMETNATAAAQTQLQAAQVVAQQLQSERAKYAHVPESLKQMKAAEASLTQAMGEEVRWSVYLGALSRSVPKQVWLKEMSATTQLAGPSAVDASGAPLNSGNVGRVSFKGYSIKYSDVATWLEALQKQKGYTDAWSRDLKKVDNPNGGPQVVEFESSVTVTKDARSGRYEGGGTN